MLKKLSVPPKLTANLTRFKLSRNLKAGILFSTLNIERNHSNLIENFLKNILYIEQDKTLTMKLMILITWRTMQSK